MEKLNAPLCRTYTHLPFTRWHFDYVWDQKSNGRVTFGFAKIAVLLVIYSFIPSEMHKLAAKMEVS